MIYTLLFDPVSRMFCVQIGQKLQILYQLDILDSSGNLEIDQKSHAQFAWLFFVLDL